MKDIKPVWTDKPPLNELDVVLMDMDYIVEWLGSCIPSREAIPAVNRLDRIRPGLVQAYHARYCKVIALVQLKDRVIVRDTWRRKK
jgi:hypothetical protein